MILLLARALIPAAQQPVDDELGWSYSFCIPLLVPTPIFLRGPQSYLRTVYSGCRHFEQRSQCPWWGRFPPGRPASLASSSRGARRAVAYCRPESQTSNGVLDRIWKKVRYRCQCTLRTSFQCISGTKVAKGVWMCVERMPLFRRETASQASKVHTLYENAVLLQEMSGTVSLSKVSACTLAEIHLVGTGTRADTSTCARSLNLHQASFNSV